MTSFNQCIAMWGKARDGRVKLAGSHTYLYKHDGGFRIEYHDTTILFIRPDQTYTLNTGGYETVTTKKKLNEHAPVWIRAKQFVWYWTTPGMAQWTEEFQDGDTFNQSGVHLGRRIVSGRFDGERRALGAWDMLTPAGAVHMADKLPVSELKEAAVRTDALMMAGDDDLDVHNVRGYVIAAETLREVSL